MASIGDFQKIDARVGRIISAEAFPEARKPSYRLVVDFGAGLGKRSSSAQLAANYDAAGLVGRLVLSVVNFPPRQIGPFVSEVLTLGVPDGSGNCILAIPERDAPLGARLY